jgi:ceramide glucosyltransferase
MAFRRHDLARVGGLESVAHVLAEDYVLGRAFHAAGLRVDVAPTPVANWLGRGALLSAFRRLLRWGMIRVRLNPGLVALEPLQRPLVCAAIGFTAGLDPGWLLPWALALTLVRDIGARALLGERRIAIDVALGPVADGLALAAWLCAWFPRHVVWRGRRVRVAAGTRLYADAPMGSPGPVVVL